MTRAYKVATVKAEGRGFHGANDFRRTGFFCG